MGSGVQFQDVAIRDRMVRANLLTVRLAVAPLAGVFQRFRQIAVNQPGHVAHGPTLPDGKRSAQVRGVAWRFGVNQHDAELTKQPRPDGIQTLAGDCRCRRHGRGQIQISGHDRLVDGGVDYWLAVRPIKYKQFG